MRFFVSFIWLSMLACPAMAQSAEERAMMVDGWARGEWRSIYTAGKNPETGEWMMAPEVFPWSSWTVESHSDFVVKGDTALGETWHVEFLEGTYRDFDVYENGEQIGIVDDNIVDYVVHAIDDWYLVKQNDGTPAQFSELRVMGDIFIWTNYFVGEDGNRTRSMVSVNQLVSNDE
ncbi:MAG: hypothetical protein AAFV59_14230 [Pseudomonadota bacterium]